MIKDFRDFILRGNVVDLAVAVVIGAAFGAVVTSLVENILTPVIGAIGGQPDFSELDFTINDSRFQYGAFLNSLISFLIIASAIFFLVVKPMNVLLARFRRADTAAETTTAKCPECMSDIPMGARRCPFCTSVIEQASRPTSTRPA